MGLYKAVLGYFLTHKQPLVTNLKFVFNFLLLIAFVVVSASGCKEDISPNEETNNRLEGGWEVQSLLIDGIEEVRGTGGTFEMEFIKEEPEGGQTIWDIIDVDGDRTTVEFEYQVENDGEEVEIDGRDFLIQFDFEGNDLLLQGIIDAEQWLIRADRE